MKRPIVVNINIGPRLETANDLRAFLRELSRQAGEELARRRAARAAAEPRKIPSKHPNAPDSTWQTMAENLRQLEMFILALAKGSSIRVAARQSGIAERTAHRRAGESAIKAQVAAVRAGLVNDAAGVLAAATSDAAQAMRKLLKGKSEAVRLAAARAILETAVKLRDATELAERIQILEQRVAAADRQQHINNGRPRVFPPSN